MKQITKITVRLEGDVNTMWTFHYSDNTTDGYYAYEGSPQEETTDRRVYDYDPKLAMLLELLIDMTPAPDDEYGAVDVEYDQHFQITKVTQQAACE